MATRIETIAGDYKPDGAIMLSDLPFPKDTLQFWLSADNTVQDGSGGILSFTDLVTGNNYENTGGAAASAETQNGVNYAQGVGDNYYTVPNVVDAPVDTRTVFGIFRAPAETPSVADTIYKATAPSDTTLVAFEATSTTEFRFVNRRGRNEDLYNFPFSVPSDKWFGVIATANGPAQRVTIEVVDILQTTEIAFTDGEGQIISDIGTSTHRFCDRNNSAVSVLGVLAGDEMSPRGYELLRKYLRNRVALLQGD